MRVLLLAAVLAVALYGQELTPGRVIEDVKCGTDPSQSYALYLPSNYTASRSWPAVLAFAPMAHGRFPVQRFQAAAERYGYIVAGSNNSHNGDWQSSLAAIRAMPTDVTARFSIDLKRVYTAGFSGGARVAMHVALSSAGKIAGVIACSAGFPDGQAHKTAPFPIFGTAGTEDFNYQEMRRLDRTLTSPHHLSIFEGTHDWLPADIAVEALEWMEIQAMKSGLRTRDEALLERIFSARIAGAGDDPGKLKSVAADFTGMKDVAQIASRADNPKELQAALKKENALEQREEKMNAGLVVLESKLGSQAMRQDALTELRDRLLDLAHSANAKEDSVDRRMARRVLRGTFARSFEQIKDPEYQRLLDEIRTQHQK